MKISFSNVIITLGILLLSIAQLQGQSREKPTWVNVYFGHQEYDGDLGSEVFEFNVGNDWAGGVGVSQYIHRYLDLDFSLTYGQIDYKNFNIPGNPLKERIQFERNFLNINALLRFKPLRNPKAIQPFVGTGLGVTPIWGGSVSRITSITPRELSNVPVPNQTSFSIPLQLGTDIRISNSIYATMKATYNRTFVDGVEQRGGEFDVDGRNHDDIMVYSVGFKVGLNKTRDTDGDGIKDKDDLCPNRYGSSFWGCPDSDGDGVLDNEDECPGEQGSSFLNGCPDSDNDGIENSQDQCPKEKGSFENNGCPVGSDNNDNADGNDGDNDGISDDMDACPNAAGNQSNNGCPEDADQDGVVNTEDKCPQVKGVASNDGCPEKKTLDDEIKEDIQNIAESLNFTVSSSNIDSSSLDDLDRLAEIMKDDPNLRLIIRGHTDNTGNTNNNLELSVERANAVKQYLVDNGIQTGRIAAFGYGETRPITSNDTQEGRLKNRRVELDLYYQ